MILHDDNATSTRRAPRCYQDFELLAYHCGFEHRRGLTRLDSHDRAVQVCEVAFTQAKILYRAFFSLSIFEHVYLARLQKLRFSAVSLTVEQDDLSSSGDSIRCTSSVLRKWRWMRLSPRQVDLMRRCGSTVVLFQM